LKFKKREKELVTGSGAGWWQGGEWGAGVEAEILRRSSSDRLRMTAKRRSRDSSLAALARNDGGGGFTSAATEGVGRDVSYNEALVAEGF